MPAMRAHLRSNVVGYVAIFLALTGAAVALPGKNKVDSGDIANGQVKAKDVRASQVQLRVDASCEPGAAIRVINEDGTVGCEPDDPGGNFVGAGDSAGGDLSGSFGNLQIEANAVGADEVADDALTGTQIDESTLENVDASTVGGQDPFLAFVSPGSSQSGPVHYYQYFMDTLSVSSYGFEGMQIVTTGTAGQFRVCGSNIGGGTFQVPYVIYVNGVRTAESFARNGTDCNTEVVYDPGVGGDFEISGLDHRIFGVHAALNATAENYRLIAFEG
jgi:hypothetical protein